MICETLRKEKKKLSFFFFTYLQQRNPNLLAFLVCFLRLGTYTLFAQLTWHNQYIYIKSILQEEINLCIFLFLVSIHFTMIQKWLMSIVAGSGLNGKHIYHCSEAVFFQNHSNTIYQNNILNSSYLFFTNYLYILQDLECLPPRILRLDHFFCNIQEISSLGVRLMQRNSNMLRI